MPEKRLTRSSSASWSNRLHKVCEPESGSALVKMAYGANLVQFHMIGPALGILEPVETDPELIELQIVDRSLTQVRESQFQVDENAGQNQTHLWD